MRENKLECCIVRDLLPSYLENLTEPETAALVKEHLEGCPACRELETSMRGTLPVERAPKQELRFLRRVKRARLAAAVLSLLAALWCMWWLYDQEFHYPNTEAGRLAAAEDYIPLPEDSTMPHGVQAGTPLRAVAWQARENHLFIFYMADNSENVHGIIHLVRGLNGKYRILEADSSPSPYAGGLYGASLTPRGTEWKLFYLAGCGCRDIYRAEVEFVRLDDDGSNPVPIVKSYDLTGQDFLLLTDRKVLEEELGLTDGEQVDLHIRDVKLFDRDGSDITDRYAGDSDAQSWGSGKTTAEAFLLYVYLGIVAALGAVLIRYFLRRN